MLLPFSAINTLKRSRVAMPSLVAVDDCASDAA
jgi:hypothetical protein